MTKDPLDLSGFMELAQEAARLGGEIAASRAAADVRRKRMGRGYVTELDRRAEAEIAALLREESGISVLGEEGGLRGEEDRLRWIVDPIDGTTNLVREIPLFACSVALFDGARALAGAIYDPNRDECFAAGFELGAHLNGDPISVADTADASSLVLFVNHGYGIDDRRRAAEVVERLAADHYLRKLGTTALEMAYVACGRADAFLCSGDELWDYAAGLILISEAGGEISDWRGRDWDGSSSFILAGAGAAAQVLIDAVCDLQ